MAIAQKAFYVSPSGGGDNSGSNASNPMPFSQAQSAIRSELAGHPTGPQINVWMLAGRYQFDATLAFTTADCSTTRKVSWRAMPGARVRWSGARDITAGWATDSGSVMKVALPGDLAGRVSMYGLIVGDVKARFSRRVLAANTWGNTTGGYIAESSAYAALARPGDLYVEGTVSWKWLGARVSSVSGTTVTIRPEDYARVYNQSGFELTGPRVLLVLNAREYVTAAGLVYADNGANTIYYWPSAGQTMGTTEALLPVLDKLVTITGSRGSLVQNLEFIGIEFGPTVWDTPYAVNGFGDLQTCLLGRGTSFSLPPGAVEVSYGNVRFAGCTFRNCQQTAIRFMIGSQNSLVSGCTFIGNDCHDVCIADLTSATDYRPADTRDIVSGISVYSNYFDRSTSRFPSGCYVFDGCSASLSVKHNHAMGSWGYSFSFSGGWGTMDIGGSGGNFIPVQGTPFANNQTNYGILVSRNLLDGLTPPPDGIAFAVNDVAVAGIYTNGASDASDGNPNVQSIVEYNAITKRTAGQTPGIYIDNAGSGWLIQGNCITYAVGAVGSAILFNSTALPNTNPGICQRDIAIGNYLTAGSQQIVGTLGAGCNVQSPTIGPFDAMANGIVAESGQL